MPIILRNLPFFKEKTTAFVHGRPVAIKGDQIIVWVGITEGQNGEFESGRPFFPAILDIRAHPQFLNPTPPSDPLGRSGSSLLVEVAERPGFTAILIPLLDADVWIRPNKPGERDQFIDQVPFRLGSIRESRSTRRRCPRPPVCHYWGFGLCERRSSILTIDGRRQRVRLRTSRRFWFS